MRYNYRPVTIVDSSIYTEDSYKAYELKVTEAKELLIDGTVEAIEAAIGAITEAKNNLELVGSSESVEGLIVEIKGLKRENYTTNSFQALMDKVAEVEGMNFNNMTAEELKNVENELLTLKNTLVDVTALRAQIEIANGFDASLYTTSSYKILVDLIATADELFVSGTAETIQGLVTEIDEATKTLVLRVNQEDLKAYINSIEEIEADKYTEETVAFTKDGLIYLYPGRDQIYFIK